MTRVVHTAQALVDMVLEVPDLPSRGGNVMARAATRYAGGAVTTLLAAARMGAPAVHAGSVGTGPNGDLVRAVLAGDGIPVTSPVVPDADTGVCMVLVEPDAERTFVTTLGAERSISTGSLATGAPVAGDLVCLSGYSFTGATREPLTAWLHCLAPGVEVVLDPGAVFAGLPAPVRQAVLARTTVWTSNAAEAADAAGIARHAGDAARVGATGDDPPGGQAAGDGQHRGDAAGGGQHRGDAAEGGQHGLCAAVAALLPAGAVVVVRDGPRGCHVLVDGVTTHLPGHPQDAVDTNGAGDVHTGAMLGERALGAGWLHAAARANIAAAITVLRRGPSTAPTRAEVDAFGAPD